MSRNGIEVANVNKSMLKSRWGATKMEMREDLGRVVVAKRDFAVGDSILTETPLLVWPKNDWRFFFNEFGKLSEDHQAAMLEMSHPPLESCGRLWTEAQLFPSRLKLRETVKLMAIANENAQDCPYHLFTPSDQEGAPTTNDCNDESNSKKKGVSGRALFLYSSGVRHSCIPCSCVTVTQDGILEYKCIRPIQRGEMITLSYIGENMFGKSTIIRRKELWHHRQIFCHCPRCEHPDDTRYVKCPQCQQAMAMCTYDEDQNEIWTCPECGMLSPTSTNLVEQKEDEWFAKLQALRTMAETDMTKLNASKHLQHVYKASKDLSPTHFITIQMTSFLSHVASAQAKEQELLRLSSTLAPNIARLLPQYMGSPKALRLDAAMIGVLRVCKSECCAAQCTNIDCQVPTTASSTFPHVPLYECTQEIFDVVRELLEYDNTTREWPDLVKAMIRRYIGFIKISQSVDDPDVATLEKLMAPSAQSSPASSSRPNAGKSNNKKRKGKKKHGRR